MRILGIDFGESRIGVAVSDPFGWTARGLDTIRWKNDPAVPVERIRKLIQEHNIERIVVGFPKNMNGTIGPQGEKTLEFIALLEKEFGIEVISWDERLSSVFAARTLHETGRKTGDDKSAVDRLSAQFILQGYLDSLTGGKNIK